MLDMIRPMGLLREVARAEAARAARGLLRVHVSEDAAGYTLRADVPGVGASHVTIEAEGDALSVSVAAPASVEDGWRRVRVERAAGAVAQTLRFPFVIDPARVQARLRDGVLEVVVPKAPAAGKVVIPVQA